MLHRAATGRGARRSSENIPKVTQTDGSMSTAGKRLSCAAVQMTDRTEERDGDEVLVTYLQQRQGSTSLGYVDGSCDDVQEMAWYTSPAFQQYAWYVDCTYLCSAPMSRLRQARSADGIPDGYRQAECRDVSLPLHLQDSPDRDNKLKRGDW